MTQSRRRMDVLVIVLAALMILVGITLVFGVAPTADRLSGGDVQRIFYFHVGIAWIAGLAMFVTFISSILYLARGEQRKYDIVAAASVEIGVVFGFMVLLSGMLWARPVWNTWWTWDARLTTVAITWLIYLAYIMLRSAIDDPQRRARFSAVYGIVSFVTVPLTFLSIFFVRTIHPALLAASSEAQGKMQFESGLASARMGMTLTFCVVTFTIVYILLLRMRIKLEQTSDRVAKLQQELVA
jgi:heme exporter protein C